MSSIELNAEQENYVKQVWDYCLKVLAQPDVSELQANGRDSFFVKRKGKRERLTSVTHVSDDVYTKGVEIALAPRVGTPFTFNAQDSLYEGALEYSTGEVDVRARCHIVLSPACDVPQITIAKRSVSLITLDKIAEQGSMSPEMLSFLKSAVHARFTTVFSGGTGSGKTTMLEACTKLIPETVRIGVAEDTPELNLIQPNTTYLHSTPVRPGYREDDFPTLPWVVRQFQRMRLDMIIVGETRGKEFAEFLVSANSGFDGSLTTLHANTPTRALERMTNFALKGSDRMPIRAVNSDIANGIDIIVQLGVLPDGRHKVYEITEVTNTIRDSEDAKITTQALYKYDKRKDVFVKENNMSDALKEKMASVGIDAKSAFPAPIGSSQSPLRGKNLVDSQTPNSSRVIGSASALRRRG